MRGSASGPYRARAVNEKGARPTSADIDA